MGLIFSLRSGPASGQSSPFHLGCGRPSGLESGSHQVPIYSLINYFMISEGVNFKILNYFCAAQEVDSVRRYFFRLPHFESSLLLVALHFASLWLFRLHSLDYLNSLINIAPLMASTEIHVMDGLVSSVTSSSLL